MSRTSERDGLRAAIDRMLAFAKSKVALTADESTLTDKLEYLNQLFQRFQTCHYEILGTCGKELIQFQTPEIEHAETIFFEASGTLRRLLRLLKDAQEEEDRDDLESLRVKQPDIQLPRINIPTFDGKYEEWPSFNDLFRSLIHSNEALSDVQRLHYLKANLRGEAECLVRHLAVTGANYKPAYDTLTHRYDNKRIIVNKLLNRLFAQPNLSNESSAGVQRMLDTSTETLYALSSLGVSTENWDVLLNYVLTDKMDSETHRLWEQSLNNSREIPSFDQMKIFLDGRFRTLEALEIIKPKVKNTNTTKSKAFHTSTQSGESSPTNASSRSTSNSCPLCNNSHVLQYCNKFKGMNANQRREVILSKGLCFNCLSPHHSRQNCKCKTTCWKCKAKHHTMLHIDSPNSETSNQLSSSTVRTDQSANRASSTSTSLQPNSNTCSSASTGGGQESASLGSYFAYNSNYSRQTLLATALVRIVGADGLKHEVRALLDQGSQATFVTERLSQRLKIPGTQVSTAIVGLSDKNVRSTRRLNLRLESCVSNFTMSIDALVLHKLTGHLPSSRIVVQSWPHLANLKLADPLYTQPGKIDVLLGADVYNMLLLQGLRRGPAGTPTAQNTTLGWILSGEVIDNDTPSSEIQAFHNCVDIDDSLKKFWQLEEVSSNRALTKEEIECERNFNETFERGLCGRYILCLPFKQGLAPLGSSRNQAVSCLHQMERRFMRCPELKEQYCKFMSEYIQLSHMELVDSDPDQPVDSSYFLPHHAVLKESSTTTKLRVVFDASRKSSSGVSLNDQLLVGPTLQDDLTTILQRWRKHRVAFTADIEKMYRQIWIADYHCDFQRIVWRNSPEEDISEYRLRTVTYGTSAAPYLAVRTLRQLAVDSAEQYPLAAKVLLRDFYVDDVMSGADDVETAIILQNQLKLLMRSGGFKLRKWTANKEQLLQNIPDADREGNGSLDITVDDSVKSLGVHWHPASDVFRIKVNLSTLHTYPTKRSLLSDVAKLFDPLGWLAPVIITAKVLFQDLWLLKLNWDDKLPDKLSDDWLRFRQELTCIESITINRWIGLSGLSREIEIHGFCDSSIKAYAAVVYARVINADGSIVVTLLAAKTKVAPIKTISIPRLELCGAHLLSRLLQKTIRALNITNTRCTAWTDSTIVLAWLKGHPHQWKTFIANRVTEIHENSDIGCWRHVSSQDNPADCASRGILPSELQNHALWWTGPHWLQEHCETWPHTASIIEDHTNDDLESREIPKVSLVTASESCDILSRFSTMRRLIRVTAYCQRFLRNSQTHNANRTVGSLLPAEMDTALMQLVKYSQIIDFSEEIHALTKSEVISKKSRIIALNPFLDSDGILRVGGRLQNADIPFEEKHQIILSSNNSLTKLIIVQAHQTTLHGGIQSTLGHLRRKYWILHGRNAVRAQIHRCMTCFRQAAKARNQLMGNLPSTRITPGRPFLHSGVDYAGPIDVRMSKGRGAKTHKAYIAIFVCLVSKAIHIELVSELSTQAFLAAFRRFVSRRGLCSHIYSDCGTNFVGASKELSSAQKKALRSVPTEVAEILANDGTTWHFIPPASPNFGGLWEAGVKSIKFHLKRIVGLSTLTFEEMTTVLIQIEAILNSRPLCPLTDDPEDLQVLTPGHFLIGSSLIATPGPDLINANINNLTRWQHLQQLQQTFWDRWSSEYLCRLQQRPKWVVKKPNVAINDLVLIKDERLPPSKWLMGRIIQCHPGSDGNVRVVTIRCSKTTLTRSISKICCLPQTDPSPV